MDECADGQRCYDRVAAAVNTGVVIYGTTQTDVNLYVANKQNLIDITVLEKNRSSNFESIQKPGLEENFLGKRQAAALFNVAAAYEDINPTDAPLVFTGGSTATGGVAINPDGTKAHKSHRNGTNVDIRYMGQDGNSLQGDRSAALGDVERNNVIIDLFALQGAGLGSAITGVPRRYDLALIPAILKVLLKVHATHMHFQTTYPK